MLDLSLPSRLRQYKQTKQKKKRIKVKTLRRDENFEKYLNTFNTQLITDQVTNETFNLDMSPTALKAYLFHTQQLNSY